MQRPDLGLSLREQAGRLGAGQSTTGKRLEEGEGREQFSGVPGTMVTCLPPQEDGATGGL